MGKGAPLRWIENKALARHLHGRGIEIGALWKKFPVLSRARVWYIDRDSPEQLLAAYPEVAEKLVLPDIVGDSAALPFADSSLGFVVASHVLEHMPFPLATLRHWYRVLAPGGVLLLKIPDKRYTFDARRKRTPLQHLVAVDRDPAAFNKRAYFCDWVENVVGLSPTSLDFAPEVDRLLASDYSIHYHVWTDADVRELIEYSWAEMQMKWSTVIFLAARFYRKECAVILQKP